jgi:hypothetical protein
MPQTNWTDGKFTLLFGRTLTGHRLSARFEKAAEDAVRLKNDHKNTHVFANPIAWLVVTYRPPRRFLGFAQIY